MATLEEINELLEIEDILASAKPEKATWGDVAKSFAPVAATSAAAGIGGAVQSIEEMNPASIAAMPYHAAGMLATPLKYIGIPEASESFREAGRAVESSFPEGTKNISIAGLEKALGRDKTLGEEAYQHWNQETVDAMPEVKPGSAKSNVLGILQNVTMNAPMMAAAALTKKPMVGLAPMGVVSGGLQYGEVREKRPDLSSGEALAGGLVSGGTEVLTEKIPLEQMIKPGYSFGKRVFLTSLADVPGEEVATTIQDGIVAKATTNPDMTWGDFVQSLKDTAIQSAGASLVQGSAAHGIVSWANRQQEKIAEEKKATPTQPPPSEPSGGQPPPSGGQGGPTFNGFEDFAGAYQDGATYDDLKGKRDEYSKRPDADPNVLSDVDTFLGEIKPPVDGKIEELKSIREAEGITDDELISQAGKLIAEYPNETDKIKAAFPNVPVTLKDALKKSESVMPFTNESDDLNKSIIDNIVGLKANDSNLSQGERDELFDFTQGGTDGTLQTETEVKAQVVTEPSVTGTVPAAAPTEETEAQTAPALPKPPEDSISGKVEGFKAADKAQKTDIGIKGRRKNGGFVIEAFDKDGNIIGTAEFAELWRGVFVPDSIDVNPKYHRTGIASKLYDSAIDLIPEGNKIDFRNYDIRSEQGELFKEAYDKKRGYSGEQITTEERSGKYIPHPTDTVATRGKKPSIEGKAEAAGAVKEPWEMSRSDYIRAGGIKMKGRAAEHKKSVARAIAEGKMDSHPDYPDLQPKKAEGGVKQEADGYVNKEIIPYSKDLKIKNIDALPRGVGARYLLAIKDDNGGLIAKQWRRTIPHPMNKIEVLIDFKPEAEVKLAPKTEGKAAEPKIDENIQSFTANLKPFQKGKVAKLLSIKRKHDKYGIVSSQEMIENMSKEDRTATIKESVDQKALSDAKEERRRIYNSGNQNIQAKRVSELDAIIANPPIKNSYRFVAPDGSFYEMTKTEYDYAKHLEGKKAEQPTVPKPEAKVEVKPEAKVIPTTKTAEKNVTTPKEQKKYLLEKIDEAIKTSPSDKSSLMVSEYSGYEEAKKKFGTVTIEVPNDGTFTIINTKERLEQFKKQANKLSTASISGVPEPKTPIPSKKASGKRLELEDVTYYNEFKPRKKDIFGGGKNYYTGGYFTEGHYIVKTEKPAKIDIEEQDVGPKPEYIKRIIPSDNDLSPANIVAEYYTGEQDGTALAHIVSGSIEAAANAHQIDAILTKHPNATAYLNKEGTKIVFKVGNEFVGMTMALRKEFIPSAEFISETRGDAKFQRGKSSGLQQSAVQSIIDKAVSSIPNAPKVNVVQSNKDCPAEVQKIMEQEGIDDAMGFTHNGEVYLVADNLRNTEEALRTLAHELTHSGLGKFFQRQTKGKIMPVRVKYEALMDAIYRAHGKEIEQIAKTTHTHLDTRTVQGRRQACEEWLCNQTYEAQPKWYDKLVAIFNDLLRAIGLDVKLSDAEVRVVLQDAFKEFGSEGVSFMTAWHGSPHDFDKFSKDKIGTGEGAQAYGYGLYFAGKKEVAEYYKNVLSKSVSEQPTQIKWVSYADDMSEFQQYEFTLYGKNGKELGSWYKSDSDELEKIIGEENAQIIYTNEENGIFDGYLDNPAEIPLKSGRLYQVELAPDEDEYLLWDKPLSEQSEKVRSILNKAGLYNDIEAAGSYFKIEPTASGKSFKVVSDAYEYGTYRTKEAADAKLADLQKAYRSTGQSFYYDLTHSRGSDKAASDYLHSLGIRGIKYLDGSSRNRGPWVIVGEDGKRTELGDEKTARIVYQREIDAGRKATLIEPETANHNYVIFDESDIEVTAKFQRQEKEAVDEASEPVPPEFDLGNLESKRKDINDYVNRTRRSLEFPEMVMLARDLLGGKFPIIMAKLRSAFGNSALGKFIPHGEGNILLKAGIFSDIDTASKVLAHEIGHLVDFLPNHLMTRGNILGRIASLNKYMKNYLEEFKGAPGLLTKEDRARLHKEAREQIKSEEKPDEVIVEEIIKEIPQYEYTGITPEIILDLMKGRVEGKIAPELYEYLQRAETKEKKQIVLKAMKDMVDERVAQFGSKKQVGTETVRETVERVIPGVKYDQQTIYKRFKELLQKEVDKRVLYRKEVISDELKKLTKLWSPFDDSVNSSYRKYRWSSKELYADAFSVFINYPELMQKEAPTFYKAFLSWIESKPEVKETYDAYQKLAFDREAVQERREKYIYEMQKGHKTKEQEVMEQIEAERKISPRSILRELYRGLIDRNIGMMDAIKKLQKAGKISPANALKYFKEERNYLASEADFYLEEVKNKILDPLKKAGFTEDDIGYLGTLMLTATQRRDVANPGGMGGYFSDEQIEHLKNKLGTERFNTLKGLLEKFSDLRQELVIPKLEEAGMYSEALLNTMKTQKNYLTFNVTKFMDKMYGPMAMNAFGKVYHTVGTFQDIQNPFIATIFKDISLMRAAEITKYKKELHKTFSENEELQDQIQPAEKKFNGTAQVFVEPKDPKMGMISYLKNGKVEAFYITKEIADDFNYNSIEAMHILKFFNALMMPVKALLVNRNPIWMFRNVVRDYLGTAQNIPGATVTNLLPYYRKAFMDAWGEVMQGKKLDVVQAMKKGKMLVIDRQYHLSDDMSDDTEFDKLYAKFGHYGEAKRKGIIKLLMKAWDFLGDLGKVSERAGKIAGYRWMKENTNMTEREIGHVVRSRIGTPDVYRRGAWQLVTNNLFLYSNVGKEGFRSSWESFQDDKAAYTWKLVKYNIMPKAVLALAALGAFGDDAEDIIKRISNYDKANYLVVPFNKTADGRAVYLRMPQSYTGQVLGAIMWDIFNLEFKKATESVAEMQPYSFNPVIKAVLNWGLYAMDTNPQDWYRGQNIVNRKEWDAGEPYRLIEMSKNTWNSLGGGLLYKFNKGQDPKGVWEQISSLPGLNILGSFLKESNQGLKEEYAKASQKAKQASALKSLDKDEAVAKRERNKRKISEAKSLLRKGFINYDTYKETVARYQ